MDISDLLNPLPSDEMQSKGVVHMNRSLPLPKKALDLGWSAPPSSFPAQEHFSISHPSRPLHPELPLPVNLPVFGNHRNLATAPAQVRRHPQQMGGEGSLYVANGFSAPFAPPSQFESYCPFPSHSPPAQSDFKSYSFEPSVPSVSPRAWNSESNQLKPNFPLLQGSSHRPHTPLFSNGTPLPSGPSEFVLSSSSSSRSTQFKSFDSSGPSSILGYTHASQRPLATPPVPASFKAESEVWHGHYPVPFIPGAPFQNGPLPSSSMTVRVKPNLSISPSAFLHNSGAPYAEDSPVASASSSSPSNSVSSFQSAGTNEMRRYETHSTSSSPNHLTDHFSCNLEGCTATFSLLKDLRDHQRSAHAAVKPFRCNIVGCGKGFTRSSSLVRHMRLHSGERPHVCQVENCGKRFSQFTDLKRHMRTHTGEKPYRCEFEGCPKSFSTVTLMRCHMRTHTGERPYTCEVPGCGKTFPQLTHLQRHRASHSQ
eukprot:GILI01021284.1.p1 GENE.GILI01021284.1~~GILI01021284.1.p1  ORF type:complete len:482 (-),score=37.18 GILI01021284.1:232-1677(-)